MEILFEDKELIVVIKERGLLSEENPAKPNMVTSLRELTKSEIYPVHRLDKDVGGVMVYAKSKKAASELSKQAGDRTMKKTYLAFIHGTPEEKSGMLEDLLFFDKSKNKSFVVKKERRGVKKALLQYEVISEKDGNSLVEAELLTGRTHQIRVQFASRKMPLFGDRRYGARDESKIIALWSKEISFVHPETKERMTFRKLSDEDIFNI
ncbi:MAG: RluA family pseudouridine synthase [Clostridia bacterium]|nr:RluA family pseudouridine synthase [Clostridia bacterium]